MEVDLASDAKLSRKRYAILPTSIFFFVGYEYGAMAGTILLVRERMPLLTLLRAEYVVGILTGVAFIGSTMAGAIGDWYGRRVAFRLALCVFIATSLAQFLALEFWSLLAARFIGGLAVGLSMAIAPVYAAELSPAQNRGKCLVMAEVFQDMGLLLGYCVAYVQQHYQVTSDSLWLLFIAAPAIILLLLSFSVMPESPRWLAMHGCVADAAQAIATLHGLCATRVTPLLLPFTREAHIPHPPSEAALQAAKSRATQSAQDAWKEILLPSWLSFRNILLPPFGIHAVQQFVFTDAVIYFTPLAFYAAGVKPEEAIFVSLIVLYFIKVFFSSIAMFLIDKAGRKKLLLISSMGLACCLFLTATLFILSGINISANDNLLLVHFPFPFTRQNSSIICPRLAITFACLAIAFYSLGLGPVPWTLAPELLPFRLRSQAMGSTVTINRTVYGCIALVFLKIAKDITPAGVFFLFGIFSLLAFVFTYFCVPNHTIGATLEEISALHDVHPFSTVLCRQRQEQNENHELV